MTRYFVIIGAQRSGTTYLHRVLDEHPEIAMARPARPEPKVFLDDDVLERGQAWYEQTYFGGQQHVPLHGEKSTSYLERPDAIERIASCLDEVDVMVLLRDPVERAISNWRFSKNGGLEERPLEQALVENLAGGRDWDRSATSVSPFAYLERGRYAEQLQPWIGRFGQRLHVLFTEEVVGRAEGVTGVYRALGVDDSYRPASLTERVNASGEVPQDAVSEDVLREVEAWFADSDRALRGLIGRPLPWDPDRTGPVAR